MSIVNVLANVLYSILNLWPVLLKCDTQEIETLLLEFKSQSVCHIKIQNSFCLPFLNRVISKTIQFFENTYIWLFLKLSQHFKTLKITNTNNLFIITSMTPSISTRFQLHAIITSSCKSTIPGERLTQLMFTFLFDPEQNE